MSGAYEVSPYLRVQYQHRKQVTPLRGVDAYASEEEQKRRGQEARKRLNPKPSKPLQAPVPTVVDKPKIARIIWYLPVDKPRGWEVPDAVQYDICIPGEVVQPRIRDLTEWRDIVREVAYKHGVKFSDIIGPWREAKIVAARHESCYRLRNETTAALPRIGRWLGDRDHSTVIAGIRRHKERNNLP